MEIYKHHDCYVSRWYYAAFSFQTALQQMNDKKLQ